MKLLVIASLCAVVAAVQYSELHDVLARSPVRTIRLSEIEAKIEAQGPIDQVGALCYQQMREVALEIDDLNHRHTKAVAYCSSQNSIFTNHITAAARYIARYNTYHGRYLNYANSQARYKSIYTSRFNNYHRIIRVYLWPSYNRWVAGCDASQKKYEAEMKDYAIAVKDIAEIKAIVHKALAGFLEKINSVKSDKMRQNANRLLLASSLLEDNEDETDAKQKVLDLLDQMRNELWKEMDRLEGAWNIRNKQCLRIKQSKIGQLRVYYQRAWQEWYNVGYRWRLDGIYRKYAWKYGLESSKTEKGQKRWQILKRFLNLECGKEPGAYSSALATKKAEIATIQKMLDILHGLKWSGAVYNAISRITATGIDENPELGYDLKFEMDVLDGLHKMNYLKYDRNVAKFARVAVKLTAGLNWVWVSFDAFSQNVPEYILPSKKDREVQQRYVHNMRVFKSAGADIKTTDGQTLAQGNIEMWVDTATTLNAEKIPGASDGLFDFGDKHIASSTNRGCFQVHDYLNKQTLLAVNEFFSKDAQGVGIGNQKPKSSAVAQPDWTSAKNSGQYRKENEKITIQWYFQSAEAAANLKNKASKLRYGSQALDPTPAPAKTYPCDANAIHRGTTEHKKWCCEHQQKPTESVCCDQGHLTAKQCCGYPDLSYSPAKKVAKGCCESQLTPMSKCCNFSNTTYTKAKKIALKCPGYA